MNIEEANARLLKEKVTVETLWQINELYILLDLDKDDFCKIVDAVGLDKLIAKQNYYKYLEQAEQEYKAKLKFLKARYRLDELKTEKAELERIVNSYKPY